MKDLAFVTHAEDGTTLAGSYTVNDKLPLWDTLTRVDINGEDSAYMGIINCKHRPATLYGYTPGE